MYTRRDVMEKMAMLSSAYKCQKVISMTLRVAIPLSLVLGILLGVLITMDPGNPISPTLPVVDRLEMNQGPTPAGHPGTTAQRPTPTLRTSLPDAATNITTPNPLLVGLPLMKPFGERLMAMNLSELRIYIYPLPKGFNRNLADCAVRNGRSGMCFDITNNGRGSLVRTDFVHGYSIYNTHQFALEALFHQRLLQSEHVTWDPHEADVFYVPYYVCMRCFCPAQDGATMNAEFWEVLLHNYTYLRQGRPHFMALGKVEHEMSSKKCPFLQGANSHYIKYLLIERTDSIAARRFFGRMGRESEVVVVPYPSYVHFDRPLAVLGDQRQANVDLRHRLRANSERSLSNRTILALLVGSLKSSALRKKLADELQNSPVGHAYLIPSSECWLTAHNVPARIVQLMHRATFCLQPPGDTPTRKSFFDSLLCGCVPVIFRSRVAYPYMDIFNYSDFSVFIPEEDVVVHNKSVISLLEAISGERVRALQDAISKVAVHFQYGSYRHGQDAFTLALKTLVHKFYISKFIDDDDTTSLSDTTDLKVPKR